MHRKLALLYSQICSVHVYILMPISPAHKGLLCLSRIDENVNVTHFICRKRQCFKFFTQKYLHINIPTSQTFKNTLFSQLN